MRNFREIALSIGAGTLIGSVLGIAGAIALVKPAEKLIDKMESEAYQKVWNAGLDVVDAGIDLADAVAEVIEEAIHND